MARKKTIEQDEFPYHITARCINKEWFHLHMDSVWEIFQNHLYLLHYGYGFEIHNFTLMNNHFHMIVRTPNKNLSKGMAWFMKSLSLNINQKANRINQLWGGRFFRSVIQSPIYYLHAYKYVYTNPLKANICDNVLNYKYSSLAGLLGHQQLIIPVTGDNTLFDMGASACVNWLNLLPSDDDWTAVERALQSTHFKLPKNGKQDSHLEHMLL